MKLSAVFVFVIVTLYSASAQNEDQAEINPLQKLIEMLMIPAQRYNAESQSLEHSVGTSISQDREKDPKQRLIELLMTSAQRANRSKRQAVETKDISDPFGDLIYEVQQNAKEFRNKLNERLVRGFIDGWIKAFDIISR